jgi:glutathione peroxidase-family protein
MSEEYDELGDDSIYLDIIQFPSNSYLKKRFKIRRLICRVCKLKFRTRGETQTHLRQEHRRIE